MRASFHWDGAQSVPSFCLRTDGPVQVSTPPFLGSVSVGRLKKSPFWRDNLRRRETYCRRTCVAASPWRALRCIPSKPMEAYLLERETAISLRRQHYDSRKKRQNSKLRHYPFLLSLDRSPPRCHFYLLLLYCCSHGSRKVEAHKKGERCEYEFSITTSVLMVPARQRSSPASIASGCAMTPSFISVDCCIVPEPYSMKKSSTATRTQSSISSIPPRQR